MRQILQKLYFDQDLFKPLMVVPHGHALACEFAQLDAVQDVLHEEYNTLASSPQFSLFHKECFEVVRAESLR